MKMKAIYLGAALAFGLASAAVAAGVTPVPTSPGASNVITVAEGCGPGMWRGEHGHCHPMFNGRACPRGYHLGPNRHRCHPN
jgi:opacity protein-like surface antigen